MVDTEVLAVLVTPQDEYELPVVPAGIRKARELTAAGAVESSNVGVVEHDAIRPAAGGTR